MARVSTFAQRWDGENTELGGHLVVHAYVELDDGDDAVAAAQLGLDSVLEAVAHAGDTRYEVDVEDPNELRLIDAPADLAAYTLMVRGQPLRPKRQVTGNTRHV